MRTKKEIEAEIAALKKLKPVGRFKFKTGRSIQLAIDELHFPFDQTSIEWNELPEEHRDIIQRIARWKDSDTDVKISEGWGESVERA